MMDTRMFHVAAKGSSILHKRLWLDWYNIRYPKMGLLKWGSKYGIFGQRSSRYIDCDSENEANMSFDEI